MKKILVTGANGLLGRKLVSDLENDGHKVIAVVRSEVDQPVLGVDYRVFDIQTPRETWLFYEDDIDIIYHLAQSREFRNFPSSATDIYGVNTFSTLQLLDLARKIGVEKFIYTSTGGVYAASQMPIAERDPIKKVDAVDAYVASKLASEMILNTYRSELKILTIRPFFIYGAKQHNSMLLPRLVNSVLSGKEINISGTSGLKINPIHVKDASLALKAAMQVNLQGIYNICGREIVTLTEICALVSQIVKSTPNYNYISAVEESIVGCNKKMISDLHSPTVNLETGIKELIKAVTAC